MLEPVRFVARTRLRRRWRAWAPVLTVVVVVAAAVMTLTAGARRAEKVYPRFLKRQHAPDVGVTTGAGIGLADIDLGRVAALAPVVDSAYSPVYFSLGRTGAGRLIPPRAMAAMTADSRIFAGGLDRVKILAGRRARQDRPDEVVADFSFEKAYGIRVGSTVQIRFATPEGLPHLFATINGATPEGLDIGPLVTFRVVGLGTIPGELPPLSSSGLPSMWMTPAFASRYDAQLARTDLLAVRLRRGNADVNTFKSAVEQMTGGRPVLFFTLHDSTEAVQRSFRSQAVSLDLLAALLALVAILFVGQALSREALAQSGDAALSAIGMTRRQRTAVFVLQGALGGAVAGTIAGLVAFLASSLMPLGLARIADPSPGLAFDPWVLGAGLVLTAALTAGLAALQGWRAEGHRVASRSDRALSAFRPIGQRLPVGARVGLGFAFRRQRGHTSVSPSATVSGIAVGLLTLIGALVFGTSLTHLIATPRLWGATWQARVGDGFAQDVGGVVESGLRTDPWVRDLAAGSAGQLELDDRVRVDAFAVDTVKGKMSPLALEGRAPTGGDEIFLGTAALRSLGAHIGDRVKVAVGPSVQSFRIVGRGPLPLGTFRDSGHSAMITFQAFKILVPNAEANIYLVDGPPGTTPSSAVDYLAQHHPGIGVFGHELPTDIADFGRVERLPLVVGGVLAVLAALILVHALVMATRARRRELAILKTLGFSRAQVAESVGFQAAGLVVLSTLIAAPLGVLAGRWSWNLFAEQIGALAVAVVPALELGAVVVGAVVIGLAVAAGPARAASRVRPALIFRAE
ncbi:MAG: FtsX-like permease family protein [Acidimicrobiales bacterium]